MARRKLWWLSNMKLLQSTFRRLHSHAFPPPSWTTTASEADSIRHLLSSIQTLQNPDKQIFEQALKLCGDERSLDQTKQLHGHMIVRGFGSVDAILDGKLITAYAKSGNLQDGKLVFEKIQRKNLFSWNSLIIAYSFQDNHDKVLYTFCNLMHSGTRPGTSTFPSVLKACSGADSLFKGRQIHAVIMVSGLESDVFVANALVTMYAKCDNVWDARQMFDEMPARDVVSWNALLAAYAQNDMNVETIRTFHAMREDGSVRPNAVSVGTCLPACVRIGDLKQGIEIHELIRSMGLRPDVFLWNALISMYCKCDCLELARKVFEEMTHRDVVSWNSIISGYAQNGQYHEALELFQKMEKSVQKPNVATWNALIVGYAKNKNYAQSLRLVHEMQAKYKEKPNMVTVASALPVCAQIAALDKGREFHAYITKTNLLWSINIGSALIDMYAKCGSLKEAHLVFDIVDQGSVVLWTTIISGYAINGHSNEAVELFYQMQKTGVKPDRVTFIAVLSACSHAGMADEGWKCFRNMTEDYGIEASLEHYACMVDLLSRSGCLEEAAEFVKNMPIEPDAGVYGSLLAASKIHGNVQIGEAAAQRLLELEPNNTGNMVLLSNLYAEAGRWDDARKIRKLIKDRGLLKNPGCSWIEIKNKVHVFRAADQSHPQAEEIYALLERLYSIMKKEGYLPNKESILHENDEDDKNISCENLAVDA